MSNHYSEANNNKFKNIPAFIKAAFDAKHPVLDLPICVWAEHMRNSPHWDHQGDGSYINSGAQMILAPNHTKMPHIRATYV